MPPLSDLRTQPSLQHQVEQRLQELNQIENAGSNIDFFKSQRGGSLDVMVKKKIQWPHEHILAGNHKDRVTYNSLIIMQWVSGFGKNIEQESDPNIRTLMLQYMTSLMEDAQDFSWTAAKASHAVLLCRMETSDIAGWHEVEKIDRIRRANAQRHVSGSTGQNTSLNTYPTQKKSMLCKLSNNNTCRQPKHHETNGMYYKHFCSFCNTNSGKNYTHSEHECRIKNKYSKN